MMATWCSSDGILLHSSCCALCYLNTILLYFLINIIKNYLNNYNIVKCFSRRCLSSKVNTFITETGLMYFHEIYLKRKFLCWKCSYWKDLHCICGHPTGQSDSMNARMHPCWYACKHNVKYRHI